MKETTGFCYVYILQSEDGAHYYSGLTDNLAERVKKHNSGAVPHTAKDRPWQIKTAIAFAIAFKPRHLSDI